MDRKEYRWSLETRKRKRYRAREEMESNNDMLKLIINSNERSFKC